MIREIRFGIGKARAAGGGFEVEIDRGAACGDTEAVSLAMLAGELQSLK